MPWNLLCDPNNLRFLCVHGRRHNCGTGDQISIASYCWWDDPRFQPWEHIGFKGSEVRVYRWQQLLQASEAHWSLWHWCSLKAWTPNQLLLPASGVQRTQKKSPLCHCTPETGSPDQPGHKRNVMHEEKLPQSYIMCFGCFYMRCINAY